MCFNMLILKVYLPFVYSLMKKVRDLADFWDKKGLSKSEFCYVDLQYQIPKKIYGCFHSPLVLFTHH